MTFAQIVYIAALCVFAVTLLIHLAAFVLFLWLRHDDNGWNEVWR